MKQAQEKLSAAGHDAGPADGKMGPKTQAAVKDFQQSKGLQASGQLDQKTIAALGVSEGGSASTGASSAKSGSAGASSDKSASAGASSDKSASAGASSDKSASAGASSDKSASAGASSDKSSKSPTTKY